MLKIGPHSNGGDGAREEFRRRIIAVPRNYIAQADDLVLAGSVLY